MKVDLDRLPLEKKIKNKKRKDKKWIDDRFMIKREKLSNGSFG